MASQSLKLLVNLPGLNIPTGYLSVVPSPSAHKPVSAFRFYVLQERQGTLVFPTASASFSTSLPLTAYDPSVLARDPIPPSKYLQLLKKHLDSLSDDLWLSLHSVQNPVRGGELLLLWAVTVWEEVSRLRDSQDMWNNAHSWIKMLQVTQQHEDHTRTMFTYFTTLG